MLETVMIPVNYLHTLQRLHQRALDEGDKDSADALLAILHRISLDGRKAASTELLSTAIVSADGTAIVMAFYYGPFHPCYLEIDRGVWEVIDWRIGKFCQPTTLLYEGGDFPLVNAGIPMIFTIRNKTSKPQTLRGIIHGYEGSTADRLRAMADELEIREGR
jgi:hypothetical protein